MTFRVNKTLAFLSIFGGMMAGAQIVQFVAKPDLRILPLSDDASASASGASGASAADPPAPLRK